MSGFGGSGDGYDSRTGPWPGITGQPCYMCTWAWYQGKLQLKYLCKSCPEHGHLLGD
jgi:hypothetical protein